MATRKETSQKVTTKGAKGARSAKSAKGAAGAEGAKARVGPDVPSLFRLNVEVGDLDQAEAFYGKLFGLEGRKQAGSRCFFTCGPVMLQVVDVSSARKPP